MDHYRRVIVYTTLLRYCLKTGQEIDADKVRGLIKKHARSMGQGTSDAVLMCLPEVFDILNEVLPTTH